MSRSLSPIERHVLNRLAEHLAGVDPHQHGLFLGDLVRAEVESESADGARVTFRLRGYERPPYRGQRPLRAEARVRDLDGTEIWVLVHVDENGHLLELELLRAGHGSIQSPQWQSLEVF